MSTKNNNKENDMDKLFFELFEQEKLEIKWHRNASLLRANSDLKEEISNRGYDIEEREFIQEAFRIANVMRDVATDEEILHHNKSKLDLIESYLTKNPELRSEIIVRTTSNLNLFNSMDYEILTKRGKNDIKEISTYSALLNISYCSSNGDEKDSYNNVVVELTKKDIEKVIVDFKSILDAMDKVGD